MLVTLPSAGITLALQPIINVLVDVCNKQLPLLWYTVLSSSTIMLESDIQPRNASDPMLVTLSGIIILVREVQPRNASDPMLVTLSGIVMLVIEVQP